MTKKKSFSKLMIEQANAQIKQIEIEIGELEEIEYDHQCKADAARHQAESYRLAVQDLENAIERFEEVFD